MQANARPPGRLGLRRLLVRKPVAQLLAAQQAHRQLRRSLTAWDVAVLGIGAIVGAGIFTTIGTAAAGDALRPGAGPSLTLSFVLTALACGMAAMCYAELAAMVPLSGSAYTYTYASLGELLAWIIGWDLMLEYAISNVAVAVSWANYFRVFLAGLGMEVPAWLCVDPRTARGMPEVLAAAPQLLGVPITLNLLAFSVTAVLTVVLVFGVRESARLGGIMVAVKVLVLMAFVGAGLSHLPGERLAANLVPYFPNGLSGTMAGAAIVFFAYIGFDTISTVAEETQRPARALPVGILTSLGVCTLLYVMVSTVFCGMLPWQVMQAHPVEVQGEPLTLALRQLGPGGRGWSSLVALGAVVAQTATLLVYQLGQPRIFFAMARDGLLPPVFARVHPRYGTPHVTTIATGAAVATASCFMTIEELIDLTNIGTLSAFVLVCLSVPILRRTDPQRHRPFRVPGGGWLLPLGGAAACLTLMAYLPNTSWWRFFAWLGAGLAVYLIYGVHHSLMARPPGSAVQIDRPLRWAGGALLVLSAGLFLRPVSQLGGLPWGLSLVGGLGMVAAMGLHLRPLR